MADLPGAPEVSHIFTYTYNGQTYDGPKYVRSKAPYRDVKRYSKITQMGCGRLGTLFGHVSVPTAPVGVCRVPIIARPQQLFIKPGNDKATPCAKFQVTIPPFGPFSVEASK